jgi:hypothetical protein
MRRFAVGKLLGIGHIALLVDACYVAIGRWAQGLLTWVVSFTHTIHLSVSSLTVNSWFTNRIYLDSVRFLGHLPWGPSLNFEFVLAVACLLVRLTRRIPGWLSLAVTLPAATYGVPGALVDLSFLGIIWPLTAVIFIASWILVAKTVRRY